MGNIDFERPDGTRCTAYRTDPVASETKRGAIVVLHEMWGLSSTMTRVADELAMSGYSTLVPDLFQGRRTRDMKEGFALMEQLDVADAVEQNVRGAVRALRQETRAVGVLGFCMGGALAIVAALRVPELSAAVCCYGLPPAEAADPAQIRIPLLCHFAREDSWCTPAKVDELERRLKSGNIDYELHRYDAAHAFMNRDGATFSAAATELAMQRTLDFFARKLT